MDEFHGIDSEMVLYYAARAEEYDDWYLRRGRYSHGPAADADWRADLESAAAWLAARPFHGRIVELAAGTGCGRPVSRGWAIRPSMTPRRSRSRRPELVSLPPA